MLWTITWLYCLFDLLLPSCCYVDEFGYWCHRDQEIACHLHTTAERPWWCPQPCQSCKSIPGFDVLTVSCPSAVNGLLSWSPQAEHQQIYRCCSSSASSRFVCLFFFSHWFLDVNYSNTDNTRPCEMQVQLSFNTYSCSFWSQKAASSLRESAAPQPSQEHWLVKHISQNNLRTVEPQTLSGA